MLMPKEYYKMKKVLNNKKIGSVIIILSVLILLGIIVGVLFRGNENQISNNDSNRNNLEQDIIVHESDENTVEKQDEDGLSSSVSEDGPVLNDEQIIDFNGSGSQKEDNKLTESKKEEDKTPENKDGTDKKDTTDDQEESNSNSSEDNNDNKENEDDEDTGSFGIFY